MNSSKPSRPAPITYASSSFVKSLLLLQSPSCSSLVKTFLRDICSLRRPLSRHLDKGNEIFPFDDSTPLRFLCKSNECSLFMFGSHSKKRPHNVVMGRTFDEEIIDMFEVAIVGEEEEKGGGMRAFTPMKTFSSRHSTVRVGSKPIVLFVGSLFDEDPLYGRLRNVLLDVFNIEPAEAINVADIDRAVVFTAVGDTKEIFLRQYAISPPGISETSKLEEIGPRATFMLRRNAMGSADVLKQSMKYSVSHSPIGVDLPKNVEIGGMGDTMGRIHMKAQNLANVAIAKLKGLKVNKRKKDVEEGEGNGEVEGEEIFPKKMKKSGPSGVGGMPKNAAAKSKSRRE